MYVNNPRDEDKLTSDRLDHSQAPWSAPPSRQVNWGSEIRWRSSSVSPNKRVRLSSTPLRRRRAATADVFERDGLNDEEIDHARDSSISRLRAVWSAIEQKAKEVPESDDEDDIVDLETGEILEDNGFLRKSQQKPIGIFAMGGRIRESSSESSSSNHDLTDREDELNCLGPRPALARSLSPIKRRHPSPLRRASSAVAVSPLTRRLSSQILRETPVPESESEDELDMFSTPDKPRAVYRSPSRQLMPPPPVPIPKTGTMQKRFSTPVASEKRISTPQRFPTPSLSNSTGSPVAISPPPRRQSSFSLEFTSARRYTTPSPVSSDMLPRARSRSRSVSVSQRLSMRTPPPQAPSRREASTRREVSMTPGSARRSVPMTFVTAAEQRARSLSAPPSRIWRSSSVSSSGTSTPESSEAESSDTETVRKEATAEASSSDSSDSEEELSERGGEEERQASSTVSPPPRPQAVRAKSVPRPVVRFNHRCYVPWTPRAAAEEEKEDDAEDFDNLLRSSKR